MTDMDRRTFMEGAGTGIAYAATASAVPALAAPAPHEAPTTTMSLTVNGKVHTVTVEDRTTLLDALRNQIGLTGTKKSCDRGECGACTVHIDGHRALACMSLAVMQKGRSITTIEGVANSSTLHPLQAAFIEHDGFQCGFCTPGMIMTAASLNQSQRQDLAWALKGNICRCTGYGAIEDAIRGVRQVEVAEAGSVCGRSVAAPAGPAASSKPDSGKRRG